MIKEKTVLFNLLRAKRLSCSHIYRKLADSFSPERSTCPHCGSTGNLTLHAYYHRHIIDIAGDRASDSYVSVPRFRCSSCGCTHALLSDALIPYRSFSITFMLTALAMHIVFGHTVESICGRYGISAHTFYRWQDIYLKHKSLWLDRLTDISETAAAFLRSRFFINPYADFSEAFSLRIPFSFLQSHKNPANCERMT